MIHGGDLMKNDVFKYILSIGFEFETHTLAKLSLHENDRFLINNNTTLFILKNKMEHEIAYKFDANNYIFQTYMPEFDEDTDNEDTSNITKSGGDSSNSSSSSIRFETLNTEYLEYINEPMPEDDTNTRFQLTNDIANITFTHYLKNHCSSLENEVAKNDMYTIKTIEGKKSKEYELKFIDIEHCHIFSGLEIVVTYLKPRPRNANIILDMFTDACSRIKQHFSDVEKTKCNLYLNHLNGDKKRIGNIDSRYLYNKPGTNLYYLQTYDKVNSNKKQSLGETIFIPQMTLRVHAWNTIEVMRELLKYEKRTYSKNAKSSNAISNDRQIFENVYQTTMELIEEYNAKSKRKIRIYNRAGKNIRFYLFMILTKIYVFITSYLPEKKESETEYLKDYMAFLPRHSNYVMYMRIKEIMKSQYRIIDKTAVNDVLSLVYQPEILVTLFSEPHEIEAIENITVGKDHEDYGNPNVSFISYFHYFENPAATIDDDSVKSASESKESLQIFMNIHKNDWLKMNKHDVFSTEYPLVKDTVLFEDRLFQKEVNLYLVNKVNPRLQYLSIKNINSFVKDKKKTRKKRT